ncbi:hypothetical protein ABT112_30655 [Streptomyces sp. NPDC002055]|uniref:hypothetical protein n=1 Tax=Streptomyces sp. NPDC002055 TaxID=3154534 RepID=UPI0033328B06
MILSSPPGRAERLLVPAAFATVLGQTLVGDLSTEFSRLLTSWNLPWGDTAVIDRDTYLPVVNGRPFETLQASGGASPPPSTSPTVSRSLPSGSTTPTFSFHRSS